MKFTLAGDDKLWADFTVFRSLFQWSGLDPATLWWVVRAAASLPHPDSAGAYGNVLGLIEVLRTSPPMPQGRLPVSRSAP